MDAYNTLVIILSIALAVFLVVGIAALSLSISFLRKLNTLVERGNNVMEDIEHLSKTVRKVTSPLSAVADFIDQFNPRRK